MRVFGCMNRLFVFYAGRVFFIFIIYVNDFKNDFLWQYGKQLLPIFIVSVGFI